MVHFFRIKEKGSVRAPTLVAVTVSICLWLLTLAVLRSHMYYAIFSMIVEYFFCAIVFSTSLRIPVQKLLYSIRFPLIVGGSASRTSMKWAEANRDMLARSHISLFYGTNAVGDVQGAHRRNLMANQKMPFTADNRKADW